jgi:hypothetical protein
MTFRGDTIGGVFMLVWAAICAWRTWQFFVHGTMQVGVESPVGIRASRTEQPIRFWTVAIIAVSCIVAATTFGIIQLLR